jgi:hypothetical protein
MEDGGLYCSSCPEAEEVDCGEYTGLGYPDVPRTVELEFEGKAVEFCEFCTEVEFCAARMSEASNR